MPVAIYYNCSYQLEHDLGSSFWELQIVWQMAGFECTHVECSLIRTGRLLHVDIIITL